MNGLCSHERLELALTGSLNADEEATLHLHLDDCESCSAEMERLAGGEQASHEIASMLTPDDLDDALPLREECSTADFVVDHLEPSDDPAVLGRLGGYDVLDIIGRGGMGVVLKGFDRELKRFVAIKALAPHLAHSALARKRFAREAQAAAAVVNLHVIAIHQVQPNGQLPFLVMPLLTGESLAQRLKARGTLELKEILRIGMQAAEGLAAAHGQGLIHRDVKPANILLEKGVERAVLTDFGLARAADDVSMTRQGIIAGTPEYMSPEQARGEALDGRSDLFSLGCVLYEMATGVSPFRTDSTMATLRRIVDEQPAAMASLVPELPPWFCHIVERLLSKDPTQRFASASEVSQLLEECLSHLQQPTSVPLPASLVPHATGRRSIFKVTREAMTTNLYAEKNGVRQLLWLRIILFSAIAPGSLALIAIPFVGWSNGAFWMMAAISWGAFAGGLVGAAKSVPFEQQAAPPTDYRLVPHAVGRRSIFNVTRKGVLAMLGTIGMTLLGMVLLQATEAPDIGGQWTSDEWGTVVLEAKGSGENEGSFTGSVRDKPAPSNDPLVGAIGGVSRGSGVRINVPTIGPVPLAFDFPGGGKVDGPNGFGISPKARPDALNSSNKTKSGGMDSMFQGRMGGPSGVDSRGIDKDSGTLRLKWSRVERRFNGTWGKGADRSGTMSLRLVDKEIRGGFTTDEEVQLETGTPLVGDLLWKRSVVTVPDGGNVLLGGLKDSRESVHTPPKIAPGEILVTVYGGRGVWNSQDKQSDVDKLLLSLRTVKGVTIEVREDGEWDAFTKAVVHMPAHAGEKDAESTKQEEWLRTVKITIDEALRAHRVPDVRWLDGIGKQQYFPADKMPAQPTNSAIPARVKYFTTGDGKKIACSPDGKLIAVSSGGKAVPSPEGWKRTVEILDAETGKTAVSISLTTQDEDALLAATEGPRDFEVGPLAFSPDGTLLAVGTGLGQVKLFDSRTGKLVLSLDDELAKLAEKKTPEKLKALKRAMGSVGSLAFSPDGTRLAMSGRSFDDAAPNWGGVRELGRLATGPGRLKVWEVKTGALIHDLVGHSHANAVAFSPDGNILASTGSWQDGGGSDHGSGVILWHPKTGAKLRTFPINTNGGTWSVAFSPNRKLLAVSSRTFDKDNDTSTSSISLLRTATGIQEWKQTVSSWGQPVAFSPDGESVAVLCGGEAAIRFFDTETGTVKRNIGLADASQGARWNDFALLPQGRRLAIAGVDNSRQGTVEIWDFPGPNIKVSAIEKPLDRQNARAVVEAFVAAALAGDGETVITLAKLNRRDPKRPTERIENMIKFFPDREHLPMTSVHVNDAENPTDAIAISKQFKWEHPSRERKTDVVAWFTLSMSEAGWIVTNISFEWIESTDGLLKKFLEAHPKSISVPPLMPMSLSNKPSEVLTAEQAIKNGKELIVSQKKVVVRLRVLDARITTRSGAEFVWELRSTERSVGVGRGTPFIIEVPTMVEAEHKRLGVHDLEEHYVGKLIEVEGAIFQLSIPGFIGGYAIRVTSLDQIRIVDPRVPDANDEQSIRWGEPVNGLRLGAKFDGANKQEAMHFRHGDRANIQLFLQNVSDQETNCGFDPADVCKWQNARRPDEVDQPPVEILSITRDNGEIMKPEPLRAADGSAVIYQFTALSVNYAKLLPKEIRRIDGQSAAYDRKGRDARVKDFVGFNIVAQKPGEPARQRPHEYVLPSGKYTAAIGIKFFGVGGHFRLECPVLHFVVVDGLRTLAPEATSEGQARPGPANTFAAVPQGEEAMHLKLPVTKESSDYRVTLLGITRAVSPEFTTADGRSGGNRPLSWMRAIAMIERLGEMDGPYGFDAQATDAQNHTDKLKVRSTSESDLNSPHLAREISPITVPKFGPTARGKIYVFTISGVFQASDLATFRFQFGTPARQQEVVFESVPIPNVEKVPGIEQSLDRQNATAVVEAWVAAVIAKDVPRASSLSKHHPARADQIEAWGNHWKLSDFSIGTAKTDEQSSPPRALVVSSEKVRVIHPIEDQPPASFLVFYLKRMDDTWFITNIDCSTSVEQTVDHFLNGDADVLNRNGKLPPIREANPKSISVPPQHEAQSRAARDNPVVGHWKMVKLADMPVGQLAGATVVIDEHRVKMHVPAQKGPHPDWRYTLGANGDIDLVDADDARAESNVRAKYSLKGNTLCLALNAKKGDHPRPESAAGDVPQEGVQYIVLELDEAKSSEATRASDGGHGTREGNPPGPEQPALSKTLQQLQGKWRLTRQIAADGDEEGTPGRSIWEFKGDRIVVRDGGPGGTMLIQVDESHSPVHVDLSLETEDESGLGLLSVEMDKLTLCLGKRQKTPAPESRPEKLQWVSGVWYVELQRVKPGETIIPLKPKSQSQPQEAPSLRAAPVIPPQVHVDESNAPATEK